jgi:hypothetical protein
VAAREVSRGKESESEDVSLSQAAEFLLDECRMVLPGIQALLGFQLIVVFNPGFDSKLDSMGKELHLTAIFLVAMAVAIVMAPAAYARQTDPRKVTATFVRISTRLLLLSMLPLAVGISIDFYLIARIIVPHAASALGLTLFLFFILLWFVLPRARVLQRLAGAGEK